MKYSIIIPSLANDNGRRALKVCCQCLFDNTKLPFELLISSHLEKGVYQALNDLAHQAKGEYLIILNDDMFVAPFWLEAFEAYASPDVLLVGSLVESGVVPVHEQNLRVDYGASPERFHKTLFEHHIKKEWLDWTKPESADSFWGFHWCISRERFWTMGGFLTHITDPLNHPDKEFWTRWKTMGYKVKRVKSWAYHLMAWTGRDYDYETGKRRETT